MDKELLIADLEQIKEYLHCKSKDYWGNVVNEAVFELKNPIITCVDDDRVRILNSINKTPVLTIGRNGFKTEYVDKGTVINIVEELPFN